MPTNTEDTTMLPYASKTSFLTMLFLGVFLLEAPAVSAEEQKSQDKTSQTAAAADGETTRTDEAAAKGEIKETSSHQANEPEEADSRDCHRGHGHGHWHHGHCSKPGKVHPFFSPHISSFFLVAGLNFLDMDSLNRRLNAAGFSDTEEPFFTLGGQMTSRFGRLVVGGEFHGLINFSGESSRDDARYDWEAWYGLFNLGVDAVQYKGLSIYPLVGIGAGTMRLKIAEESGASFDDVLQDPGRSVTLTQRGLLLDAGLGVDYRFTMRERETSTSYLTIGVRGGYLFAPYSGNWKMKAGEISDGPMFGITGPYAKLMIGFSFQRGR